MEKLLHHSVDISFIVLTLMFDAVVVIWGEIGYKSL